MGKVVGTVRLSIRNSARFIFVFVFMTFMTLSWFSYQVNAAKCQHQYSVIEREEPTEDSDGFVAYKCDLCGQEYTDILFATSHEWGGWVVDKQPTDTEPGLRHRTCNRGLEHTEWEEIPPVTTEETSRTQVYVQTGQTGVSNQNSSGGGHSYTKDIITIVNSVIGLVFLCKMIHTVFVFSGILYRYRKNLRENENEYIRRERKERMTWS